MSLPENLLFYAELINKWGFENGIRVFCSYFHTLRPRKASKNNYAQKHRCITRVFPGMPFKCKGFGLYGELVKRKLF